MKPNKWVQWHVSLMWSDLRWWPKMVCVPYQEGTNPQYLASLVAASFKLPGVQFAWQGDAFWSDPACLQFCNSSHYISPVERLFSGIDYSKQRRDKTLSYAWALYNWVEKADANPSSRSMAQCMTEMQERMYGLIEFTLKDLQALPALDLALRS